MLVADIADQAAVVPLGYGDSALSLRPWLTGMWVNMVRMSSFADAVVDVSTRQR